VLVTVLGHGIPKYVFTKIILGFTVLDLMNVARHLDCGYFTKCDGDIWTISCGTALHSCMVPYVDNNYTTLWCV